MSGIFVLSSAEFTTISPFPGFLEFSTSSELNRLSPQIHSSLSGVRPKANQAARVIHHNHNTVSRENRAP